MANESQLMKMLAPVLERMGADGQKIAKMIEHEMKTEAILEFCNAQVGMEITKWTEVVDLPGGDSLKQVRKAAIPIYRDWKLGEANPLRGDATVWAIIQTGDHVVIFSLRRVQLEERTGFQFFKDVVFHPLQVSGQISHKALVGMLLRFMNDGAADFISQIEASDDDQDEDDETPAAASTAASTTNGGKSGGATSPQTVG